MNKIYKSNHRLCYYYDHPNCTSRINKLPDDFGDFSNMLPAVMLCRLKQVDIKNTAICGYITPSGTYYKCSELEHQTFIKNWLENHREFNELFEWWMTQYITSYQDEKYGSVFDSFVISYCGWVKVGGYPKNLNKDDVHYMLCADNRDLTDKQAEIVYPR